jgi:hypothetical protein
MKLIVALAYLVVFVAACASVYFVGVLKPTSPGAYAFFAAWLLLPYVVMCAAFIEARRKSIPNLHWHIVSVLVSVGGILFLMDTIFWHPDPQGAISVLLTPIFQGVGSFLLLAVSLPFANKD